MGCVPFRTRAAIVFAIVAAVLAALAPAAMGAGTKNVSPPSISGFAQQGRTVLTPTVVDPRRRNLEGLTRTGGPEEPPVPIRPSVGLCKA